MFVLWECEKADYSDSVGRYRYDEPERPGRNHQLFAWAKPENVHETALDVFMAAIQLLQDKGYQPRYSYPPHDCSHDRRGVAILDDCFGLCPGKWGFVDIQGRNLCRIDTVPGIRFTITKPKPEQTEMERWKASMPELSDYLRKKETDSFSEAEKLSVLLSYDGCMARYGVAMKKWISEMPDA